MVREYRIWVGLDAARTRCNLRGDACWRILFGACDLREPALTRMDKGRFTER